MCFEDLLIDRGHIFTGSRESMLRGHPVIDGDYFDLTHGCDGNGHALSSVPRAKDHASAVKVDEHPVLILR